MTKEEVMTAVEEYEKMCEGEPRGSYEEASMRLTYRIGGVLARLTDAVEALVKEKHAPNQD